MKVKILKIRATTTSPFRFEGESVIKTTNSIANDKTRAVLTSHSVHKAREREHAEN